MFVLLFTQSSPQLLFQKEIRVNGRTSKMFREVHPDFLWPGLPFDDVQPRSAAQQVKECREASDKSCPLHEVHLDLLSPSFFRQNFSGKKTEESRCRIGAALVAGELLSVIPK